MKSFLNVLLLILGLISCGHAYIYNVTVSLSGTKRFDNAVGRLKINFIGAAFDHESILSAVSEEFKFGTIKTYMTSCPFEIDRVQRVALRFTLSSPYNPFYILRGRYVYVSRVDLVPEYEYNLLVRYLRAKHFCPTKSDAKLTHKDPYVFVQQCYY